jgi:acetylornithine/succinyldiaminopimelate/putrescine aminotransferase
MVDALAAQRATHMTLQVIVDPASFSRVSQQIEALARNCLSLEENLSVIQYAKDRGLQVGAVVCEPNIVPILVQAGVSFFKVLLTFIKID